MADILGTHVMNNKTSTLSEYCFANVRLPLKFKNDGEEKEIGFMMKDVRKVQKWLRVTSFEESNTYPQISPYGGSIWVRLSGQIYVGLEDIELAGYKLKELCERLNKNPGLIG